MGEVRIVRFGRAAAEHDELVVIAGIAGQENHAAVLGLVADLEAEDAV